MPMPSILITGANGFVGQELATGLLNACPDTRLTLTDVTVAPPVPPSAKPEDASRITSIKADLTSQAAVDELISSPSQYDAVYILHGIMSGASEANFDLGMKINFFSVHYMFERLRKVIPGVKVVFASSLAVYGPTPPGFKINERNIPPLHHVIPEENLSSANLPPFYRLLCDAQAMALSKWGSKGNIAKELLGLYWPADFNTDGKLKRNRLSWSIGNQVRPAQRHHLTHQSCGRPANRDSRCLDLSLPLVPAIFSLLSALCSLGCILSLFSCLLTACIIIININQSITGSPAFSLRPQTPT